MGAHPSRLNVVLDRETRKLVIELARRRATSVSVLAAELIREAIDRDEDRLLVELATSRERAPHKRLPHKKVW